MSNVLVSDVVLPDYKTKGTYTPAKKIDMGNSYLVFVSGVQAPKDDTHRVITEDIEKQTKLVFEDIIKILGHADASINDVVKAVIYVTDISNFDKIAKIRDEYFRISKPVSTFIEVNRMTRDGAKIEIEVTAIVQKG